MFISRLGIVRYLFTSSHKSTSKVKCHIRKIADVRNNVIYVYISTGGLNVVQFTVIKGRVTLALPTRVELHY